MRKLSDLEAHEVSLVPRGANKKKFLIFKSQRGNTMPRSEIVDLINAVDPKTMARVEKAVKSMKIKKEHGGDMMPRPDSAAYKDAGSDRQVTDNGLSHTHAPLSDRAQAALKAVARILAPFKDEINDGHLDAVQSEVGIDPDVDQATPSDDDETQKNYDDIEMSVAYPQEVEEEHSAEALKLAKKAYGEHLEKMGYRKYPDPSLESTNASKHIGKDADMDDEDDDEEEESVGKNINKSADALDLTAFPKNQRAQLEAIFKANNDLVQVNKALVQKTADLEKRLEVERNDRVLKGFKEKARGFKHLGVDTDELAVVMKSLAESEPSGYEKIEAILKSADEQLRVNKSFNGGIYGEMGTKASNAGGGDPGARLDALVDSVVAKSEGKTREQVYEEVLKSKEGKRLYAEYKASRPHGA